MKLIAQSNHALLFFITYFVSKSKAQDTTQVEEALEDDDFERKYKSVIGMVYDRLQNFPGFLDHIPEENRRKHISKKLQNYGCSCFPDNAKAAEKTQLAVDELDTACRNLRICRRCVEIEYPGQCDTDYDRYKWTTDSNNGMVQCNFDQAKREKAKQDSDCEYNLCQCDAAFVDTVFELWTGQSSSGWAWNDDYWRDRNYVKVMTKDGKESELFDYNNSCYRPTSSTGGGGGGSGGSGGSGSPRSGGSDVKCCGDYPNKSLYNSKSKKCCNEAGRAYSPVIEVCCENSSTVNTLAQGCV